MISRLEQEHSLVLVIDDDQASQEAVRELLHTRYEVLSATDGAAGVRLARLHNPDLILMDLEMPRQDGLGVLKALQEDPQTQDAPVIFITGERDQDALARCLELGATDFLSKPLQGRVLIARMERALRESRERKALQALAQTDALTGLANFRALSSRLGEEFRRATRYRHGLAAVMIDLDNLKQINDRYGHEVGNQAILTLSRQLRACLREVDFAARFGGDEFLVLLPHQTYTQAAIFAERLRSKLGAIRLEGAPGLEELRLTISVGIAAHGPKSPKPTPDYLLQVADAALYESKRRGRDRIVVYERDLEAAAQEAAGQRH
jgi:diguanylate cyclase (GGDEF)-like protein